MYLRLDTSQCLEYGPEEAFFGKAKVRILAEASVNQASVFFVVMVAL